MSGSDDVSWVEPGKLRVALFLPQYSEDEKTGGLRGVGMGFVAIEVARTLAARLGVELDLVTFPNPAKAVDAIVSGICDLAFLGIEPLRAAQVDFSPALIQFDYSCLVPAHSAIVSPAELDCPDVRISVVRNHASTIALTRLITHATLIGSDLPEDAFKMLQDGNADAMAAPRDHLDLYSRKLPGSRVLPEGYGTNNVGIALQKRQPGRHRMISDFVDDAKSSQLIATIIQRGGLHDFRVPPGKAANA